MALERGRIVRSRAGKDKDSFLAVVSSTRTQVLVCDGKKRPLERPKCKSMKHITMTSFFLDEGKMATNRELRLALRNLNFQSNADGI